MTTNAQLMIKADALTKHEPDEAERAAAIAFVRRQLGPDAAEVLDCLGLGES